MTEVVRTRALAAIEEVVQRHPDRTVLLMAHLAVNKVLIAAFIGLDNSNFWRIGKDTTAINRFHLGGRRPYQGGENLVHYLR